MNKLTRVLGLAVILFICNTIALSFFVGVPYVWTLSGETVEDTTCYTGSYYKINDNLKIVVIKDRQYGNYDRYVVYEKDNDKWGKTDAWSYTSMFTTRTGMLFYMRTRYIDYKRSKKRRQKGSVI